MQISICLAYYFPILKILELKKEQEKPPSFQPIMYTAQSAPKKARGHVADLTVQAGETYVSRLQRARETKMQQKQK